MSDGPRTLKEMNAIGAAAPMASRLAATTVRGFGSALDCCDREAVSFLATTGGISGDDVRDLMVAAVEHRFGRVNRLPVTIEWLSDNGSCYLRTRSPVWAIHASNAANAATIAPITTSIVIASLS